MKSIKSDQTQISNK